MNLQRYKQITNTNSFQQYDVQSLFTYNMSDDSLMFSHKPEVLRLHQIEEQERNKFCSDFSMVMNQLLPSSTLRKIKLSKVMSRLLAVCPDAYYTFITTLRCRRRLGQEYTYIAMYKNKHYEQEGVLMNKKTRSLLVVLELLSRHLIVPSFVKMMNQKQENSDMKSSLISQWAKIQTWIKKYFGSGEQILSNVQWLVLMLFMLNWNKRYTIIQSLLGISYVYTYKSEGLKDISYKIQGYLILVTLVVKVVKHLYGIYQQRLAEKQRMKNNLSNNANKIQNKDISKGKSSVKRTLLCTICTCEMSNWSSTKCGHLFCWQCIIQALQNKEECPICRTRCHPREVVQLKNH